MKVVLSPRAVDDLREIQAYIAYDNVSAAARVASRIRGAIAMLQLHPRLGHVYEEGPERRLVVPGYPYCIYYDLNEPAKRISVLTIQHTHRRPPRFG
jgi:plasmid stabilization system protein ParE